MTTRSVTTEQLRGLEGLHRAVAISLIKKGSWRLAGDDLAEMLEHDQLPASAVDARRG